MNPSISTPHKPKAARACAGMAAAAAMLLLATAPAWADTPPVVAGVPATVNAQVGQFLSIDLKQYVTATDGDAFMVDFSEDHNGALQAGCQTVVPGANPYDANVGLFTATPTQAGTYACLVAARDKDGSSPQFPLKIVVAAARGNPAENPGNVAAVPALGPAGLALLSTALAGVGALRRRKRG